MFYSFHLLPICDISMIREKLCRCYNERITHRLLLCRRTILNSQLDFPVEKPWGSQELSSDQQGLSLIRVQLSHFPECKRMMGMQANKQMCTNAGIRVHFGLCRPQFCYYCWCTSSQLDQCPDRLGSCGLSSRHIVMYEYKRVSDELNITNKNLLLRKYTGTETTLEERGNQS